MVSLQKARTVDSDWVGLAKCISRLFNRKRRKGNARKKRKRNTQLFGLCL